jgi:hypothetical protein
MSKTNSDTAFVHSIKRAIEDTFVSEWHTVQIGKIMWRACAEEIERQIFEEMDGGKIRFSAVNQIIKSVKGQANHG